MNTLPVAMANADPAVRGVAKYTAVPVDQAGLVDVPEPAIKENDRA